MVVGFAKGLRILWNQWVFYWKLNYIWYFPEKDKIFLLSKIHANKKAKIWKERRKKKVVQFYDVWPVLKKVQNI